MKVGLPSFNTHDHLLQSIIRVISCLTLTLSLGMSMQAQLSAEQWLKEAEEALADGRITDAGSSYSGAAHEQLKSGDYEAAAENFKKAAEQFRKDGRTAQAGIETTNAATSYESAAEKAAENGDHKKAADLYDKAAEQYDADGRTVMAEGARRKAENERTYLISHNTTATGNTSGIIANVVVTNTGQQAQSFTLPAGTIPSQNGSQGFVVPTPSTVSVPAGGSITVPVTGYCMHPDLPPPPSGSTLPSPRFDPEYRDVVTQTNRIISVTSQLVGTPDLNTPFDNPGTARDLLIQYTVWTTVPESPLTIDDICVRFISDYETTSGKPYDALTPSEQAVVDYSTLQVRDAVTKIGRGADIPSFSIPALPPDASNITSAPPSSHPDVANTIKVTSTERPTGHIADLTVSNPTDRPVAVKIGDGSAYIPGNGNQPMVVPEMPPIQLAPGETKTVPVYGYCADIGIPPTSSGGDMLKPKDWISMGGSGSLTPPTIPAGHDLVTIPTSKALPYPKALTTLRDHYTPAPHSMNVPCPEGTFSPLPFIPGTSVQLPQPLDPTEYPGVAVPLILDALNKITQTYDELSSKSAIQTPFSGNPPREREAVIQQTFWRYTSALRGKPYEKEKFRGMTAGQFEQATGNSIEKSPPSEQEKFESGVDAFWLTFDAVIKPTGVPVVPTAPAPVKTVEDDINNINPAQIKEPRGTTSSPGGTPSTPGQPIDDPNVPPELIGKDVCDCGPVSLKATLLGIPMQEGEAHSFNTTGNQRKMISESKVKARTGDKLKIDLTDIKTACGSCNNRQCDKTNLKITAIYGELSVNTPNRAEIARGTGSRADVDNNSIEVDMPAGDLDVGFFITVTFDCSLANCGTTVCDETFVLKVKRQGVCACKETYLTTSVTHTPAAKKSDKNEEEFTFTGEQITWDSTVVSGDVINVAINKTDKETMMDNLKAVCDGCQSKCVATNLRYKVFGTNIDGLPAEADAKEEKYSPTKLNKLLYNKKITGDTGNASVSIKVYHTCESPGCDPAKCEKTFTIIFVRK